MPVYEFLCRDCEKVTAEYYKTYDDYKKPPKCKYCGSENMKKIMSGGQCVVWKGGKST